MTKLTREQQIAALEKDWKENPRWKGVKRGYSAADVVRLRGSLQPEYTLAKRGAEKLWEKVNGGAKKGYVNAFGAITAGQAMQQAKAGLEAVYLSGWQVAADGNTSETMYPDQSLYAYDSVPTMVRRINNTFKRADEIQWSRGINPGDEGFIDYFLPIVDDAEAGFGGVLNAFELMKNMIAAGAAGVHFEDQLAAVKKCGHMGGKVLVPTQEAIEKLIAARFAADVMGVPTIVLARTDPQAGKRGFTTFIVDPTSLGYNIARVEDKLGQRTAHVAQIQLDNLRVPAENVLGEVGGGYRIVMGGLSDGRIAIAAQAVGVAQAALDAAIRYANEREAYGKPIVELQAVSFHLAEMAAQVDVARQYYIHAPRLLEAGASCAKEAAIAKLVASEMAEKVCSDALQIHGGYGYLKDFPVERYYRDVRVCKIYEGTSDIQKQIIARSLSA